MAQATLPVSHNGPWRGSSLPGWTLNALSVDGADLAPSTAGGSAQFRQPGASIIIQYDNGGNLPLRLSYSLRTATTRADYAVAFDVAYSVDGATYTVVGEDLKPETASPTRYNDLISANARFVKFSLKSISNAYLLLDALELTAAPEITAFAPASGVPTTPITISGYLFSGATRVSIGGVDVAFTVNPEGTSIATQVPLGASTGNIEVETPSGTVVSATEFTVPAPAIAFTNAFTPTTGNAGITVSIKGKFFTGVDAVTFNKVPATEINVISDTEIRAVVPFGASTGKITVSSPAGSSTSIADFTVPAPKIATGTEFAPTVGGAGKEVTIFGSNLSSVSKVTFLGNEATTEDDKEGAVKLPYTSDTQLVVIVPAGAATGKIKLTTADNKSVTTIGAFTFIPAPVVASLQPTFGLPGDAVVISGQYFTNTTEVRFGNIVVPNTAEGNPGFTVNAEGTEISTIVPEGAMTAKVTVTTVEGGSGTSEDDFLIIQQPVVSTISPTEGIIGDVVTISGQYLTGVTSVTFLGAAVEGSESSDDVTVDAANFVSINDTQIRVAVPAGAVTGELQVNSRFNPVVTEQTFAVIIRPIVNSFNPTLGLASDLVTISGFNFTGATEVTFGGVALQPASEGVEGFTVVDAETITAAVPASAVTGKITVTSENGTGASENDFVIIQQPVVSAISPLEGIVGDVVTISGQFFAGVERVAFVGAADGEGNPTVVAVDSADFVSASGTEIKVAVPANAVTGVLTVTNRAGFANTESFRVITAPEIVRFSPAEGKVGDPVAIEGWLLGSATSVAFNGVAVADGAFTVSTDGKTITTTVPANATTGEITVETASGPVSSEGDFVVIPVPYEITFNPASGLAETLVTIRGKSFDGFTEVAFNGVAADISGAAIVEQELDGVPTGYQLLSVEVPRNATTGKVSITAAGGTGTSEAIFTVPTPTEITFTPTTSYAYQAVVIRGKNFKNVEEITFNGEAADLAAAVFGTDGEFETITIPAPFDAGTGVVTVTTPAGPGSSVAEYAVIEPSISGITAVNGYAGYTQLTITGENFTKYFDSTSGQESEKKPVVTFAGAVATVDDNKYSDTSIEVLVPESATTGRIRVESGSGIGESEIFYILAPVITNITPTTAYAGQTVTITGDNFIDVTGLSFKGIAITDFTATEGAKGGKITFKAPFVSNTGAGLGTLRVTTKSGSSSTTNNFTVIKPEITGINPTRQYAGLSRTVTLTGSNFEKYYNGTDVVEKDPIVRFTGNTSPASLISSTDSEIVAVVPAGATTGAITVESGSGIGQSGSLTIIGTPTISSFSPAADIEEGTVTINGTFFDEATKVTFLGAEGDASDDKVIAKEDFVSATNSSIQVRVPVGANTGKLAVTNLNATNDTGVSANRFRVVKAPIVEGFSPESGPSNSSVTITGENLTDVDVIQVYFRGHNNTEEQATVTDFDNFIGTSITVTVPVRAISGVIRVVNTAGQTTTVDAFDVTSPLITGFENNSGPITSARVNETIKIKGYKLSDVSTVQFTGFTTSQFLELDENTLEVKVPRGARTGKVTVNALGGSATSVDNLTIVEPTITVTPASLATFGAEENTLSAPQQYNVSAVNLEPGEGVTISVTRSNQFQISLDGVDYSAGPLVLAATDGTLTQTPIFVRYAPTEIDYHSATIANVSPNAVTRNVSVTGNSVTPLPVELISFKAALQNNNVLLTWATASEENNSHFEVEMSRDAKDGFEKIGHVDSKATNSSIKLDYEFTHKLGNITGAVYYRLKQVDTDGTVDYSKVVAVNVKARELVQQLLVAPNPINYNSKLFVTAEVSGKAKLTLHSMTGKKVYAKVVELEQGQNEVQLPVYDKLSKGMYVLSVELNEQVSQIKLMKE